MVEVCVRVSLQTPAGIEVNYVENILTIHYYFSDGFYIVDEFNVERPEGMYTIVFMLMLLWLLLFCSILVSI